MITDKHIIIVNKKPMMKSKMTLFLKADDKSTIYCQSDKSSFTSDKTRFLLLCVQPSTFVGYDIWDMSFTFDIHMSWYGLWLLFEWVMSSCEKVKYYSPYLDRFGLIFYLSGLAACHTLCTYGWNAAYSTIGDLSVDNVFWLVDYNTKKILYFSDVWQNHAQLNKPKRWNVCIL